MLGFVLFLLNSILREVDICNSFWNFRNINKKSFYRPLSFLKKCWKFFWCFINLLQIETVNKLPISFLFQVSVVPGNTKPSVGRKSSKITVTTKLALISPKYLSIRIKRVNKTTDFTRLFPVHVTCKKCDVNETTSWQHPVSGYNIPQIAASSILEIGECAEFKINFQVHLSYRMAVKFGFYVPIQAVKYEIFIVRMI